jgi:hydroxylamine reductase
MSCPEISIPGLFLTPILTFEISGFPYADVLAWYEQKAVIVLLALLYLGVKNIHLGPTLPAFLSPNVAKVLTETFGIAGITEPEADIKLFLGENAA